MTNLLTLEDFGIRAKGEFTPEERVVAGPEGTSLRADVFRV
jgi:hypothetical protein